MTFKEYKGLDLVGVSNEVLQSWKEEKAFEKSLELREGCPEFIFFEGPPSANGMPGIHHVMARSIKDAICRYKTQTGYRVERRAGWDTHGLPVELGVEKMLQITKEDIGVKVSVEQYNDACRSEVMKYTAEWRNLTNRVGYWVDMDDPYITYDNRYIETLWYLLKDIYNKGLLYKGYSIQPYSPAAGTGLSTHELNQPGCYRDVKDTTCTAQFSLVRDPRSEKLFDGITLPICMLAWTTTPWTLPSNTALCVGPNIDYVRVKAANPYSGELAVYVVAKARLDALFSKIEHETLPGVFKGRDLVGIRYRQLIPWFNPGEGAFCVIPGDYVTTEDGTGVVHIAPTFGADDNKVAKAAGVPPMQIVDSKGERQAQVDRQGRFYRICDIDPEWASANMNPEYAQWEGRYVKNAYDASLPADAPTLDVDICVMLKGQGKAFKIEKHTHTYPHCWRTDKPVLYYPLDSWFIRTTAVREKMMALNDTITWKPEATGTGRFGKWLENIQDWNLSRSRYWGTPLPIWRSEDGKYEKCIGSVTELYTEIEKSVRAGLMPSNPLKDKGFVLGDGSKENMDRIDLHRPYVDRIVLCSPDNTPMKREPDLIDVWFDSGAMPYAQEGLRNLGKPCFGQTADFIAEGVDQTRGWFYTLHAINTMVSGKCAYKRVISNGLVLDKAGNKMSKRLGNAVNPFEMLDKYGADAIRWYMLTNAQPWDNLKFDEAGVDEVRRKFFGTLYNTYSFFALYANIDGFDPVTMQKAPSARTEMDRWIDSLLNTLIAAVTDAYEDYDLTTAGRLIQDFVCNDFSNWYVRLCRKRFWGGGMTPDKLAAYQTMFKVLAKVSMLAAPIAPFYMDRLFTDLSSTVSSVHYTMMPRYNPSKVDKDLERKMELAQKASSMVLALRRKVNIKVRQPLSRMVIPVLDEKVKEQLSAVQNLILAETNVKSLEFIDEEAALVTKKIKPNFKTLGKRYGAQMKEIASAFASLDQAVIGEIQKAEIAGQAYVLGLPSGDVVLSAGDYSISSEDMPGWLVASEDSLTVALDVTLNDDLVREGTARELVNRIQNIRKDSGLEVTDKVDVCIWADGEDYVAIADSLSVFASYIGSQTLATGIKVQQGVCDRGVEAEWGDSTIKIEVNKN